MQKMIKNNIVIEVKKEDIDKAIKSGFLLYNGTKITNAEVDFDE